MKMHITPDWLRNKIETTPETEIEAGVSTATLENLSMFLPSETIPAIDEERITRLKHAFGLFVRNLRLKSQLSIDALAQTASVDKEELLLIETDPHYVSKPRTIYQLSNYFGVSVQKMMKIAGVSQVIDHKLEEETLQYAAKSDGVSSLNKEEQHLLNEYVKFLNES